jgi:hypothetical protein
MTIYSYEKVTDLLTELNLETVYHGCREHYFKLQHPELHQTVLETTEFLGKTSFTEKLFCYTNGITKRPKCKMCDNEVSYCYKGHYHTYCYKTCALLDQAALNGVENISQLQSVKDKKLETMRTNHGVDNPSELQSVKDKISIKAKERWAQELGALVEDLGFEPLNCTQKQYYKLVWRITEYMYRTHQTTLDPDKTRSKKMHLDHMVSLFYGFQNNLSPIIIGDITNLRMIPNKENTGKSFRNAITIDELFTRYNEFYDTNEKPPLDENLEPPKKKRVTLSRKPRKSSPRTKFTADTGVCKCCGGDANFVDKAGIYQCHPKIRHCPIKREENNRKARERDRVDSAKRKLLRIAGLLKRKKRNTVVLEETRSKLSMNSKGKRWFNNGKDSTFALECPPGYVEGRGKQMFNNGVIQIMEFSCPAGFVLGFLPRSKP